MSFALTFRGWAAALSVRCRSGPGSRVSSTAAQQVLNRLAPHRGDKRPTSGRGHEEDDMYLPPVMSSELAAAHRNDMLTAAACRRRAAAPRRRVMRRRNRG